MQAAAEKPPRSRGDYPGMVQVISLSKESEIRIDGTLEYYSSRTQSPDLPGMVQMYEKNHLYPQLNEKRQYLGNSHDNVLFCISLLTLTWVV